MQLDAVRSRFPALARPAHNGLPAAYLDGPGGTQVPESVMAAITDYLTHSNSNIEGQYELSEKTDRLIERARAHAGAWVGGDADCITFGQNMTTLNFNLARAIARTLAPGDEIITTRLDHDGNVSPWLQVARDFDLVVRTVGLTDELNVDLVELESLLSEKTKVIAFTLASNAVGTLTPARTITDMAHGVGALAWVDAVAYAPHRRINVSEIGCDVLLCSPYKFFGPHLGLAWMRRELAENLPADRVRPAGQEPPGHRFETGTLSHEALAGFVAAVEYVASLGQGDDLASRLDAAFEAIVEHETELAMHFMQQIGAVPGVTVVGPQSSASQERVGTFGMVLEGRTTEDVSRRLGASGVYTWNGNFYAIGVTQHLGLDEEDGILRVGMVHYNTKDEVDRFASELTRIMNQ